MGLKKGQTHSSSFKKSTENEYRIFRKHFVFSCVDILLIKDGSVLLTKRTINPHKGSWHLPGSIIRKNETMKQTVRRTAKKELNINDDHDGIMILDSDYKAGTSLNEIFNNNTIIDYTLLNHYLIEKIIKS